MITLQKENYKIDSTGWEKVTNQNGVKVKENPEGDVWEYLEGDYKGEQLFTRWAVERLGIKDKLPTHKQIEELIGDDYEKFLKDNDIKFCGYRKPFINVFYNMGKEFKIWCKDNSVFKGYVGKSCRDVNYNECGFSVRLISELDSFGSTVKESNLTKPILQHGALREDKTGKLRRDLIPIEQLRKVAARYTEGVTTHGARNRENGDLEFAELCKQSCFRHFYSYMNGEVDENHFGAIVFNLFAYDFLTNKHNKNETT